MLGGFTAIFFFCTRFGLLFEAFGAIAHHPDYPAGLGCDVR